MWKARPDGYGDSYETLRTGEIYTIPDHRRSSSVRGQRSDRSNSQSKPWRELKKLKRCVGIGVFEWVRHVGYDASGVTRGGPPAEHENRNARGVGRIEQKGRRVLRSDEPDTEARPDLFGATRHGGHPHHMNEKPMAPLRAVDGNASQDSVPFEALGVGGF